MRMANWRIGLVLVLGAGLSGCGGGDGGAVKGMSKGEAQRLNAQRSQFERGDDPPFTADTHFAAGRLAEAQGAFPQAVAQYQAALKLEKAHRPALYRLGALYAQLGQYPDAIGMWERYIKATGQDATGWSNLAYTYELAGEPRKAEEAYLKGIGVDAKNEPCRVNYGLLLVRMGRVDEAEKQMGAVLTPAQVRYNIASAYEQMGRKDAARVEYRKALELDAGMGAAKAKLAELMKN